MPADSMPSPDKHFHVAALADRLAAIGGQYPAAQSAMVADIARAVIETLGGDISHDKQKLLTEVEELGRTIAAAKVEIAAIREDRVPDPNVSGASDELDAVVAHTAEATNVILEVCEALDTAAGSPQGPSAAFVTDATSRIYEACSFQDIAGQRITKVVGTLKAVEARIAKIVATFGQQSWDALGASTDGAPSRLDAHLLNGPQMSAAAMAQDDIDAMLADF